ncbi:MAG TPA: Rieske (2Fe-2S) protein, partial [Pseudonocardia sp.]
MTTLQPPTTPSTPSTPAPTSTPDRTAHQPTSARPQPEYSALNPAYPRSWWMVAFSCDVKGHRTVPLRVLERDVVLWRDSGGAVHCQAGHCPHLGAHFGYGGEVIDDELRCGFHGWRFAPSGQLAGVPGPDKPRANLCLPTYRIVERHGALFLWNGAGEPDIEFPDFLRFLADIGATEEDVTFHHHRWFLPFPAKWFGENLADGMHFAVAHDTGEWGDTIINFETPTMLETENAIYERRDWWSAENIKRRFTRRELINLLTPVVDNVV